MGLVSLVLAYFMGIFQTGDFLQSGEIFWNNVASAEEFFFKLSWFIWGPAVYAVIRIWKNRAQLWETIKSVYVRIWSLTETWGLIGVIPAIFGGLLYSVLMLNVLALLLGALVLPLFEGISAGFAQNMANAWLPSGPTPDFFLYLVLWLIFIPV